MLATVMEQLNLRRYGPSPGSHSHAHFQVLWGWHGTLELEIEGRGARVEAGRVAVIPPSAQHDFRAARGRADCFVVDTADAGLEPLGGRVLAAPPALGQLLGYLQSLEGALPAGAASLLLQSLWQGSAMPGPARGRPIDWHRLQAWVDVRLAHPLTVSELARQVHLSPSQFAARCVEHWGLSPMGWVRSRRLAAARRLLAQGLPVGELALRCGYRSPSALTAALRRFG
jgi:AraC-like DNA-binding protein